MMADANIMDHAGIFDGTRDDISDRDLLEDNYDGAQMIANDDEVYEEYSEGSIAESKDNYDEDSDDE